MSERGQRFVAVGLALWVVGVFTFEAVASVGMVVVLLGVTVHQLRQRRAWNRSLLVPWVPLLGFVAWAALAPALAGRWATGTGLGRLLELLVIPIAAHAWLEISAPRRRVLILIGTAVFVLSCAVAGFQHFGLWPAESAFSSLRWTKIAFHRVYEAVPGTEGRFMAGGLAFHRLKFAHVGALAASCAVAFALRGPQRLRAGAWGVAAVGALSILFFPYARMAAAALGVSAVVVLAAGATNRARGLVVGAGLAVVAVSVVLAHQPLRERFLSSLTSSGNGGRADLLATGLRAVSEYPVVGTGVGNFRPARFASPDAPVHVLEHAGKSHNQFVSIAAETGLPGLALFLLALMAIGLWLPKQQPEGLAALGGLVLFLVLSATHDPLFHPQFSMAWALLLGVGVSGAMPNRAPAPVGIRSGSSAHTLPS